LLTFWDGGSIYVVHLIQKKKPNKLKN
jgi:hypothetical protein